MAKGRKDSEESSSLEESDNRTQSSGTESDSVRSRSKERKVSYPNSSAYFIQSKREKKSKKKSKKASKDRKKKSSKKSSHRSRFEIEIVFFVII